MHQRARDALGGHHKQADEDIGDLTDGGIGQPFFQQLFAIGHHRAHQNRQQRQRQQRRLHPRSAQEIRADRVVQHAYDRQHAGLGNDARENGRGRSGRGRVRRRQPAVQRIEAGLRAEADDAEQGHDLHQRLVPPHGRAVERAAGDEAQRRAVARVKEDEAQPQERARDGIKQILQRRADGLVGAVVQHERHGQQRGHLKEEIHRDQVFREAHADQRGL